VKSKKEASAPKKVRKISKRTAKRKISKCSKANKKLVEKKKVGFRKANYNSWNIKKANWVYQPSTPVGGIRGALLSAIMVLTVFFGKRNTSVSPAKISQTDGKKSIRRIGKTKSKIVVVMVNLPNSGIVLLTLPNSNQIITALLKIPRSYRLKGDWARARINACTDNPNIVILPATITAYLAHLAAFVIAQTNMQTGTRGNRPIRDNAWQLVENDMKALLAVAQANANDNPSTAIAIIESGLFFVKSMPAKPGRPFKVVNTNTSGTMSMRAPGASRDSLHVWEKSVDGIIFTPLGSTHKAKLNAGGFTPVSKAWVRHRTDLNGVFSEWQYFYVTVN